MRDELVDFRGLLGPLLRGWWLLIIGAVLGGLIAVYTFEDSVPSYASTAKLFVQGGSGSSGISASGINEARRISQLYVDLATTRPILEAISENETVPYSGSQLRSKIRVSESRSFIEITVVDGDPVIAAVIANATAVTLINELAKRQIAQFAQFQDSLGQLGLEDDAAIFASQAANLPLLSVAEQAVVSEEPIGIAGDRVRRIIYGWTIGLILAAGLLVVRSWVNDTVNSEGDLITATGLISLGVIPKYRMLDHGAPISMNGNGRHHLATEAYHIVRTNLDYALGIESAVSSVLITGPGPGEGKSTLASNLAVTLAQEGNSVVLVDGDLRRPVQHILFDIDPTELPGLTEVLEGSASMEDALHETTVKGLKVLISGKTSVNPGNLLRSKNFSKLKKDINAIADFVIYDSPPVLVVSDPLLLADEVDVAILVSEAGNTTRGAARKGAEVLRRSNAGVIATVLTKQRSGISGYGYGYGYSNYYGRSGDDGRIAAAKRLAGRAVSKIAFWKKFNNPRDV